MNDNYKIIKQSARELVAKADNPLFYKENAIEYDLSTNFFKSNSTIVRLREFVTNEIENDFGHGLHHAIKVAIDAGTLVLIECNTADYSKEKTNRLLLLAQCAGLLHDIKRKEKNHALKGAEFAAGILKAYPLESFEIDEICLAIKNHEAFQDITGEFSKDGQILSDCLYDADKFRWGPDNFAHTVWDMVSFSKIPPSVFILHFPKGMKFITKIKSTFRSETGKKYGPDFINIGISIGNKLYNKMISRSVF